MTLQVGDAIPAVTVRLTGDRSVGLIEYLGKYLILYFYPKASTPGCTQEGLDFNAALTRIRRNGGEVLGVSRDSLKAQENFKAKQGFRFDLISDADEQLCALFGVVKDKQMYGKQVRGIERSTFLIDPQGRIVQAWRGVKVAGHVDAVIEALRSARQTA